MGANYQKQMVDRVSGMVYAYDYAVKHGLDALKKELQFRRATYLQMEIDTERCNQVLEDVFTKIYNAYNVAVYKVSCMTNTILQEKDLRISRMHSMKS